MSFDAICFAWRERVTSSAERLVLLALADCARNGHDLVFVSRERLRIMTMLDPKTISTVMKGLSSLGLIQATGERRGRTRRIRVYRLQLNKQPENGRRAGRRACQSEQCEAAKEPVDNMQSMEEKRTYSLAEMAPNFRGNRSVFGSTNAPKNGTQSQGIEPGKQQQTQDSYAPAAFAAAADLKFPIQLPASDCEAARTMLTGNPKAQQILDELSGIMSSPRGANNPMALLRTLCSQAKAEKFTPTHAHRVQAEREHAQVQIELRQAGLRSDGSWPE